jgi:tetratricopeptide (TPR) repeat protein
MRSYSVRDVERLLQLPPGTTRNLVRAGFVKPARGARRAYRFSFQDLIVLRTARALLDARIPARRIRRSLASLRRELPQSLPLSGLSISAVGDHVVVRDGEAQRQVESGQYLLGLDVTLENGVLHVVEHHQAAAASAAGYGAVRIPKDWFGEALALESSDSEAALEAYRRAVDDDPHNLGAWTNWGRLLHALGRTDQAAEVYRHALEHAGTDALLLFNQGVLLEDLGKPADALEAYRTALAADPDLADCHYNLARLYESLGKPQHAIRHLGRYRRLVSHDTR